MLQIADMMHQRTWSMCLICDGKFTFENPQDFVRHLRSTHCTKEGGSFVCRYGRNGVCPSLPVEGVSDVDYEAHIEKHHVRSAAKNGKIRWRVINEYLSSTNGSLVLLFSLSPLSLVDGSYLSMVNL